jgi:hypothetical protein
VSFDDEGTGILPGRFLDLLGVAAEIQFAGDIA